MHPKDRQWAVAYAKQALSDLNARDILALEGAEKCQRLHFLQMAAEKVCKAHLVNANGHDNVRKTHAYVAKNLPIIARQFYSANSDDNQIARWAVKEVKHLAREIEFLAPASDDSGLRPDNSEYPWDDAKGKVQVPCEFTFPNIDDSAKNLSIVRLIKLMRAAAETYAT
jgi:hypothetical protein